MTKRTIHEELEAMRLPELQAMFTEVTGEETKDRSKKRIISRIEEARESIAAIEKGTEKRAADGSETAEAASEKKSRKKAKAAEADAETETPEDDGEASASPLRSDAREDHFRPQRNARGTGSADYAGGAIGRAKTTALSGREMPHFDTAHSQVDLATGILRGYRSIQWSAGATKNSIMRFSIAAANARVRARES